MTSKTFMKFIFTFCLLTGSSLAAEKEEASEQDIPLKFKLGFEFQEVSHLCPWHSRQNSLQNKSLFTVKYADRNLWKVVIDTFDIEFVTFPFRSDEGEGCLSICMQSIFESLDVLQGILRAKDEEITEKEKSLLQDEQKNPLAVEKIKEAILVLKEKVRTDNEIIFQVDENIEHLMLFSSLNVFQQKLNDATFLEGMLWEVIETALRYTPCR